MCSPIPLYLSSLTLSLSPSLPLSLPPSLPPSLPRHTGKHVSCGYEDGGVRVWNLKECTTVSTMSPSHSGSVHCLAAHADGRLLMTGSDDSTACLVNSTTGKVTTSMGSARCTDNKYLMHIPSVVSRYYCTMYYIIVYSIPGWFEMSLKKQCPWAMALCLC